MALPRGNNHFYGCRPEFEGPQREAHAFSGSFFITAETVERTAPVNNDSKSNIVIEKTGRPHARVRAVSSPTRRLTHFVLYKPFRTLPPQQVRELRVAILTRDFPPAVGGISTHVSGLVNGLRGLGVEVDVHVGRTDSGTLFLPLHMSASRYDLVHAQSGPYGAFVFGVPLVVTVHAPIVDEWTHYAGMTTYTSLPAFALERLSLRRASAILAVSTATKQHLVERYGLPDTKVTVVGNGVEFDRFAQARNPERVPNRIVMVSRLEPRKNIPEAFKALARLPRDSYEAQVVGDGSQMKQLKSMAELLRLNVTFMGRVASSDLPRIYNSASIFLSTSHSEGFGLTLLEAMACVPRGTVVDTSTGALKIENLSGKEFVLTHRLRLKPIAAIYRGFYSGALYRISTTHGWLYSTPEHKMMTDVGWQSVLKLHERFDSSVRGRVFVYCRFSRRRRLHDSTNSSSAQSDSRIWFGPGGETRNPSGSESFERQCARMAVNESWRLGIQGSQEARVEVASEWKSKCGHAVEKHHTISKMQAGCCTAGSAGMRLQAVFREKYGPGLALASAESQRNLLNKFEVLQRTPTEELGQTGWVEVRDIEKVQYTGDIFDLSVVGDNSYCANGFFVHNSGCGVIASDISAHRELVTSGKSGLIYRSQDELQSCLKRLMADGSLRAELAEAGRTVARRFSWESVSLNVLNAYLKALSAARGR